MTDLMRNPFAVLAVSTRHDRYAILEMTEERSLELDHDICQQARSALTTPRRRISAELAWLPGVSPNRAAQLLQLLVDDPMAIRYETGIPPLAHLNLMATALEALDAHSTVECVSDVIEEMSELLDEVSVEHVMRDVNEDRAVSGFAQVKEMQQIESELADRKRYYRNSIRDALNRLPASVIVEAMTLAVDRSTRGGERHAPELIDELVDSYAVEAQSFLESEAKNVHRLIESATDAAHAGEDAVDPIVSRLEAVARNWDRVAQPIQISMKARGIVHEASHTIAYSIRELAIDLVNKHEMLEQSQRLMELIPEIFAELPEIVERVEQDTEALSNIFRGRNEAELHRSRWEQEITYSARIGLVFKEELAISPKGISWEDKRFPLEEITRVRWGGVRHSVNGIPTGTTFTIAFGDKRSEAVVELRMESIYREFIEKLWRAVGIRLLTELLVSLRSGVALNFGDGTVRDEGILLTKHNSFFRANENVYYKWCDVSIWSADGAFYVGAKDDKNTHACMRYIDTPNTHILEQAVRMGFKKPGMRRLSELLN